MNKTTLFFCPSIKGHKLEYISHLYKRAVNEKENKFVFVVPEAFLTVSNMYDWPQATNVLFDFIQSKEEKSIFHGSGFIFAWHLNKTLSFYSHKHRATNVFLIDIVPYLPFLCFQRIKVSGIIYHIYLYSWKESSLKRRIIDYCRQAMLAYTKNIERVFVLNDELGTCFFNRRFHSAKYTYLPDPVPNLGHTDTGFSLRSVYSISNDSIIMLHAGGMLRYKGTLNILKTIKQLNSKDRKRFCFVFAGRITDEISKEFHELYDIIKETASIVLIEGYLAPERLNSLFEQSDFILIPYYPRSQSSGIIGLGAMFNKPVITTAQGVVGRLVKKYQLGILLKNNTPETIKECLRVIYEPTSIDGRNYLKSHDITVFQHTIFSLI